MGDSGGEYCFYWIYPNENWGLWNFNVYLNQRHLGFGLLMAALVLWIFLDWVEESCAEKEKGILWLKNRFLTKKHGCLRNPIQLFLPECYWVCVHFGMELL